MSKPSDSEEGGGPPQPENQASSGEEARQSRFGELPPLDRQPPQDNAREASVAFLIEEHRRKWQEKEDERSRYAEHLASLPTWIRRSEGLSDCSDSGVACAMATAFGGPSSPGGPEGRTPLHEAAHLGLDGVCRELLAMGVDPMLRDAQGRRARTYACSGSHEQIQVFSLPPTHVYASHCDACQGSGVTTCVVGYIPAGAGAMHGGTPIKESVPCKACFGTGQKDYARVRERIEEGRRRAFTLLDAAEAETRAARRAQQLCELCGRPLSIMDRLRRRTSHAICRELD